MYLLIFLACSTQFVFLIIRLVPANVVMVTIDMCGKSSIIVNLVIIFIIIITITILFYLFILFKIYLFVYLFIYLFTYLFTDT